MLPTPNTTPTPARPAWPASPRTPVRGKFSSSRAITHRFKTQVHIRSHHFPHPRRNQRGDILTSATPVFQYARDANTESSVLRLRRTTGSTQLSLENIHYHEGVSNGAMRAALFPHLPTPGEPDYPKPHDDPKPTIEPMEPIAPVDDERWSTSSIQSSVTVLCGRSGSGKTHILLGESTPSTDDDGLLWAVVGDLVRSRTEWTMTVLLLEDETLSALVPARRTARSARRTQAGQYAPPVPSLLGRATSSATSSYLPSPFLSPSPSTSPSTPTPASRRQPSDLRRSLARRVTQTPDTLEDDASARGINIDMSNLSLPTIPGHHFKTDTFRMARERINRILSLRRQAATALNDTSSREQMVVILDAPASADIPPRRHVFVDMCGAERGGGWILEHARDVQALFASKSTSTSSPPTPSTPTPSTLTPKPSTPNTPGSSSVLVAPAKPTPLRKLLHALMRTMYATTAVQFVCTIPANPSPTQAEYHATTVAYARALADGEVEFVVNRLGPVREAPVTDAQVTEVTVDQVGCVEGSMEEEAKEDSQTQEEEDAKTDWWTGDSTAPTLPPGTGKTSNWASLTSSTSSSSTSSSPPASSFYRSPPSAIHPAQPRFGLQRPPDRRTTRSRKASTPSQRLAPFSAIKSVFGGTVILFAAISFFYDRGVPQVRLPTSEVSKSSLNAKVSNAVVPAVSLTDVGGTAGHVNVTSAIRPPQTQETDLGPDTPGPELVLDVSGGLEAPCADEVDLGPPAVQHDHQEHQEANDPDTKDEDDALSGRVPQIQQIKSHPPPSPNPPVQVSDYEPNPPKPKVPSRYARFTPTAVSAVGLGVGAVALAAAYAFGWQAVVGAAVGQMRMGMGEMGPAPVVDMGQAGQMLGQADQLLGQAELLARIAWNM